MKKQKLSLDQLRLKSFVIGLEAIKGRGLEECPQNTDEAQDCIANQISNPECSLLGCPSAICTAGSDRELCNRQE